MALKFRCIAALGLLGLSASCSDPVPPASQGSASIHVQTPATPGVSCGPGVHTANAPTAQMSQDQTSGQGRPKDVVIDGEQGRHFSCSVKPSGDGFVVAGDMNVPAFDKNKMPLPIPTQITISIPSIAKDQSTAMGTLLVADNDSAGAGLRSDTCVYSVKPDTTVNRQLGIGPGKIWGSVTCTNLKDPRDPGSSCDVDVGYFVMENCDQ
jgi:hypothetical protein